MSPSTLETAPYQAQSETWPQAGRSIEDITSFVIEQRQCLSSDLRTLMVPEERIYRPADEAVAAAVGIDQA